MAKRSEYEIKLYRFLIAGFIGQVAGRLVDLQWHLSHEDFETAADQVRAHLLMWIATLFVIIVSSLMLKANTTRAEQNALRLVLASNVGYIAVGVVHFLQHLDHQEVDVSHLLLAITNLGAVVGIAWVAIRRRRPSAAA